MITLVKLVQTCAAYPSQWDGWDAEGNYYYIRYRYGILTVEKGDSEYETIVHMKCGDTMDGVMTVEEMLEHTEMELAV